MNSHVLAETLDAFLHAEATARNNVSPTSAAAYLSAYTPLRDQLGTAAVQRVASAYRERGAEAAHAALLAIVGDEPHGQVESAPAESVEDREVPVIPRQWGRRGTELPIVELFHETRQAAVLMRQNGQSEEQIRTDLWQRFARNAQAMTPDFGPAWLMMMTGALEVIILTTRPEPVEAGA